MNPRPSRRRRCAINSGRGSGRESKEGPVLVLIEGPFELGDRGGSGDLLFHEAAEDHESAGAEPCHRGAACGSDGTVVERHDVALIGAGSIDDFRLWGSRPCRRMGGHLTRVGWRTQVVHAFGNHKTVLSEGAALAAVVEAIPGNPHRTWVGTDSPSPLR